MNPNRHFPRICRSCGAPMATQEDSCWRCGEPWQDPPDDDDGGEPEPGKNGPNGNGAILAREEIMGLLGVPEGLYALV